MKARWLGLVLLLVARKACTSNPASAAKATTEVTSAAAAIRSAMIQANGQSLHVLTNGKGPLILFLHGFPEDGRSKLNIFITPRPRIPTALAVGGIGLPLTPSFGENSEDFY